MNEAALACG